MVLVDTPGVGGLGSSHGAATMGALPKADAVLLVSDAAQEYTAPELDFLAAARQLCPNVACVITKTDLYRTGAGSSTWTRDTSRWPARPPGSSPRCPPPCGLHALRTEDNTLMEESGFVELIHYPAAGRGRPRRWTWNRPLGQPGRRRGERELATGMRSELIAQQDPGKGRRADRAAQAGQEQGRRSAAALGPLAADPQRRRAGPNVRTSVRPAGTGCAR